MIKKLTKYAATPGRDIVTLVYSVNDVLKQAGFSRPTLYKEINSGRLRTFKVGTRRLISAAALTEWIRAREKATSLGDES